MRTYMQDVCGLAEVVEHETQPVEPLFDEPPGEEELTSIPARMFAPVGAWLVERFANVPASTFIEDGRLAAYSRELQSPVAQPQPLEKVIH